MRLSDHLEHESGLTIFQHACRVGLEGIVSSGITLPFWPVPGLDQIQEPECACGNARRGRRLVALMTTLTMRMIKGDFVVTGPDVEPMRFKSRAEARDWCKTHHPGSAITEVDPGGKRAAKKPPPKNQRR